MRYESVLISVGKDTPIRATMELAAVSEAVSVSGAAPDINPRKTVTGANFEAVEMQEIPTSRDPWAILRQVPGVILNQVNVGGNATGVQAFPVSRGSIDIQYQLDGVTITDPVDLGTSTYFNFGSYCGAGSSSFRRRTLKRRPTSTPTAFCKPAISCFAPRARSPAGSSTAAVRDGRGARRVVGTTVPLVPMDLRR